jgi:hypothetical protein
LSIVFKGELIVGLKAHLGLLEDIFYVPLFFLSNIKQYNLWSMVSFLKTKLGVYSKKIDGCINKDLKRPMAICNLILFRILF